MKRLTFFQPGYWVALVIAVAIMVLCWGWVYAPGSSGSNVMLGILLALAVVYILVSNLGPFIQDKLFHGGDPERAVLIRQAEVLLKEGIHLLKITEKKRLVVKEGAKEVPGQAVRDGIADLERVLTEGNQRIGEQITNQEIETKVTCLQKELERLEALSERKRRFGDFSSLLIAFALAYALRAFCLEPFQIPSGSMIPTLLVGDHLFVSKSSYGFVKPFGKDPGYLYQWSQPQPGEVVVFEAPAYVGPNHGEAWIKRVVAGPGQTVFMKDSVVHVDGQPYKHLRNLGEASYKDYHDMTRQWLPAYATQLVEQIGTTKHSIFQSAPTQRNWPNFDLEGRTMQLPGLKCGPTSCTVNEGHIFVMGDNRDNSSDGRRWGAVPINHVKGKALFIWMSVNGSENSISLGNFVLPVFRWERWLMEII